jgi:hypothetical protein
MSCVVQRFDDKYIIKQRTSKTTGTFLLALSSKDPYANGLTNHTT